MIPKRRADATYLILNAFYHDEHHQLVVHWIEAIPGVSAEAYAIVIVQYAVQSKIGALMLLQVLNNHDMPTPIAEHIPYALALQEIQRLEDLIKASDLPIHEVLRLSAEMMPYILAAGRWEHDRKN